MFRSGLRAALVVSIAFLVVFVSCTKRSEETAASTPAAPAPAATESASAAAPASTPAAPAASAPAADPAAAIASTEYTQNPAIRADLLEVRRVSGGALLVKWRVVNTQSNQPTGLAAGGEPKPIHYDFSWDDLYYVDPAENKKYEYLKDSEGNRILDVWWGDLKPGEQRTSWAKFPAPPPTSTKIAIMLPKFSPLEDVPVAQ